MNRLPRENAYLCPKCGGYTVSVDVAEGVTPMFLGCRAAGDEKTCDGMAQSSMYPREPRPAHVPAPAWEWYKPTRLQAKAIDAKHPGSFEHWEMGGLFLRPRTNAEPVYHGEVAVGNS